MKTSTMLIITAVLITLGSLIAYNYKLKDVYLTGEYKSRFNGMVFTPLNDVEKINIQTEKLGRVQIEYGEKEGVWINKKIKDKFKFGVSQQMLTLGISDAGKQNKFHSWGDDVIIVTKKLNAITTAPPYNIKQGESMMYGKSEISVKGYQLDQLDLQIANAVSIYLHRMQLNTLNANVGNKETGDAELILSSDTKINNAQLNVPGSSKLTMLDPKIVKTNYNLSDSATVSLNGKLVQMIR